MQSSWHKHCKLRVIKFTRAKKPWLPALITSSSSLCCMRVGITRWIPNACRSLKNNNSWRALLLECSGAFRKTSPQSLVTSDLSLFPLYLALLLLPLLSPFASFSFSSFLSPPPPSPFIRGFSPQAPPCARPWAWLWKFGTGQSAVAAVLVELTSHGGDGE